MGSLRGPHAAGEGWWSRRVTLPHELACRASAFLVCHDPNKIEKWQAALVLPQANRVLETRLHELVRGLFECRMQNVECRIAGAESAGELHRD